MLVWLLSNHQAVLHSILLSSSIAVKIYTSRSISLLRKRFLLHNCLHKICCCKIKLISYTVESSEIADLHIYLLDQCEHLLIEEKLIFCSQIILLSSLLIPVEWQLGIIKMITIFPTIISHSAWAFSIRCLSLSIHTISTMVPFYICLW